MKVFENLEQLPLLLVEFLYREIAIVKLLLVLVDEFFLNYHASNRIL